MTTALCILLAYFLVGVIHTIYSRAHRSYDRAILTFLWPILWLIGFAAVAGLAYRIAIDLGQAFLVYDRRRRACKADDDMR